MSNTLQPSRGLFASYLGLSFQFTEVTASFLKQNGVKVFYKNPTTGQIQSWASASSINALTGIKQFNSYQIDNNSTQPITFNSYWFGFGVIPEIRHLETTTNNFIYWSIDSQRLTIGSQLLGLS